MDGFKYETCAVSSDRAPSGGGHLHPRHLFGVVNAIPRVQTYVTYNIFANSVANSG
jgi:hypothetical protein